jgi:hypothetical protein
MEIDFPCGDAIWRASTCAEWTMHLRHASPVPSFRDALRSLAGRGITPEGLSDFGMWILLHGLISISWVWPGEAGLKEGVR